MLYDSIYVKYPEKFVESGLVIAQNWIWKPEGLQAQRTGAS